MKHSSVAIAPCEFINVSPVNPLISKCQIKVCYVGDTPNRNRSIITKEVATEMANSLPGSPIVGYYNEKDQDFEEHNRELEIKDQQVIFKDVTKPYGFVDLHAKCWFQKFLDDGQIEHEYLMTEGYLWTGQYPEAKRIIESGNNQSMELDENFLNAQWTKDNNGKPTFFIINEAIISKLCILGEDFEPCFEGSTIAKVEFSLGEDFKTEMFSMIKQMQQILDEGGKTSMENENKVIADEKMQSPDDTEFKKKPEDEEAEKKEDNSSDKKDDSNSSEKDSSDKKDDSASKKEDDSEDKNSDKNNSEEDKNSKTNNDDSEDKSEDEKSNSKKKKKDFSYEDDNQKQYNLEEFSEYTELASKYSELEQQYNDLKTAKTALETEIEELKTFKLNTERVQKQDMINNTFYMLSDEDKKDVIDNIDVYSLDEIEAKLSVICVRNKVSFAALDDTNNDGSTTFNMNNIDDEDSSVPAWIKAVLDTAKQKTL